jgi:hypothetical protein
VEGVRDGHQDLDHGFGPCQEPLDLVAGGELQGSHQFPAELMVELLEHGPEPALDLGTVRKVP